MKHLALILLVIAPVMFAQTPDQPFPNHETPPDGWYCSPTAAQSDHKCSCKRMDSDELCEGEPQEDAKCKVWCHKDHCRCPVVCGKKQS